MKDFSKKMNTLQGFTIIETLVAILILLLVIMGPMTIAQRGIQTSYFASEQLTAIFLAQEALEGVRKLRDDAALFAYEEWEEKNADNSTEEAERSTWDWVNNSDVHEDCFFTGEHTNASGCAFDLKQSRFEQCVNDCALKVENGEYGQQGAVSPFKRKVYMKRHDTATEQALEVIVEVKWNSTIAAGGEKTVTLQSWVYDQYERYEYEP